MPISPCEALRVTQSTTDNHVTYSNIIMLIMMKNPIQLEVQIAQMIKQIEVFTKNMNENDAQITSHRKNKKYGGIKPNGC